MKVKAIQTGKLAFEIEQGGHKYFVDGAKEFGGEDKGPSPKGLLLGGLAGCTGMDVASILEKMHVKYESLEVFVDAGQTDQHPKIYKDIVIEYHLSGPEDLDIEKIKRAVDLSQNRYCGVSAMLGKASNINHKIFLNDRLIHEE